MKSFIENWYSILVFPKLHINQIILMYILKLNLICFHLGRLFLFFFLLMTMMILQYILYVYLVLSSTMNFVSLSLCPKACNFVLFLSRCVYACCFLLTIDLTYILCCCFAWTRMNKLGGKKQQLLFSPVSQHLKFHSN